MKAADPKAADAAPPKSKKMLIIIIAAVVLGGGAAAGFFLTRGGGDKDKAEEHKSAHVVPPVYVAIEPFTVNLQPETGDQYLQIQFTLQVANEEQVELIKANMPKIRGRMLLLLSAKKASELNTTEGKKILSTEIIAQAQLPFAEKGEPQKVSSVDFTSFIIQ